MPTLQAPEEFTKPATKRFVDEARVALDEHHAGVRIDFTHVVSVGAAGGLALLALHEYAAQLGGDVLLVNVPDDLADELAAAGVDRACYVRRADARATASRRARANQRAGRTEEGDGASARGGYIRLVRETE
ncbi:STAS domain-containing protein [Gemmatirosa kalamazoonensis]|nr:STAS domain-containing protein [Gemmatirosa kalamazoonensis]